MAQHRGQSRRIISVLIERVILRNGFGFRINYKLVRIATTCLAIQRRAPLAENFLKFFLWLRRNLFHRFDSQRAQGSLCDFSDPRNFSHRKRGQKSLFAPRRNPNQSPRLALIGSYLSHQPCRSEATGTWQTCSASNATQQFIRRGKWRSVQTFCACEIEIRFVDGYHFHHGRKVCEYRSYPVAPLRILRVVTVEKNSVGAQASRSSQRHR